MEVTSSTTDVNNVVPSQQPLSPDVIQQRLKDLDISPTDIPPKRGQQWIGWFFLIVIPSLLILGIASALGWSPKLELLKLFHNHTDFKFVSTGGHQVLLMIQGKDKEFKLVDTQTQIVRDISQGDSSVSHAGLSPDGIQLAYIRTDDEGSSMYLVDVTGNITQTFSNRSLTAEVHAVLKQDTIEVCPWSDLKWSPNMEQIGFFACDTEGSVLVVVPTQKDSDPKPIKDTKADNKDSIEILWVDDDNIAMITGDGNDQSLVLINANSEKMETLYGQKK